MRLTHHVQRARGRLAGHAFHGRSTGPGGADGAARRSRAAATAGGGGGPGPRRLFPAGSLDPTFGLGGKVLTAFPGSRVDDAYAAAAAPGGKVVVAGSSNGDVALARYNANGSLDTTFGVGGAEGNGLVLTDFGLAE